MKLHHVWALALPVPIFAGCRGCVSTDVALAEESSIQSSAADGSPGVGLSGGEPEIECGAGEQRCGERCYSPAANEHCCPDGMTVCNGAQSCCGQTCYQPSAGERCCVETGTVCRGGPDCCNATSVDLPK
jgi:hypothetical protein